MSSAFISRFGHTILVAVDGRLQRRILCSDRALAEATWERLLEKPERYGSDVRLEHHGEGVLLNVWVADRERRADHLGERDRER